MGKRTSYDSKENIIYLDLTGVTSTKEVIDEAVDEVISQAQKAPQKPILVSKWTDAHLLPEHKDYYGKRAADMMKYLRAVVRYDATDIKSRMALRAETIKYGFQGANTYFYPSRDEALKAIREGQIK